MIRKTFKKYCLLAKTVDNTTVDRLMGFDFHARSQEVLLITEIKWQARKENRLPEFPSRRFKLKNLALYPRELQELLNLKTAMCPLCKVRLNTFHLRESHKVSVPGNIELLDLVEKESIKRRRLKLKKKDNLKVVGNLLRPYITSIKQVLSL